MSRPWQPRTPPTSRRRRLPIVLLCLLSLGLGLAAGHYLLRGPALNQPRQLAHRLSNRIGLTHADAATPGHWGVMRPGMGGPAPDADQLAEIKRLQSLGYVGGSQPPSKESGTTINLRGSVSPSLRFYVSGDAPGAELIDTDGRTRHRWRFTYAQCRALHKDQPDLFLPDRDGVTACWRRARLLPDGSVLAIFEGHGLVHIDRESELLWAYPGACHHDLDLAPDGSIYVLTREARIVPQFNPQRPVLLDFITHLDADGRELESIDLLAAFENSIYASFLDYAREAGDIMHTNTLELLDGRFVDKSPVFAAGNFLISVRELDVVAIVDPNQQKVVWALSGMWSAQHQPTLLDNGNLLIFDNQGYGGQSKVLEIEPLSQRIVWEFTSSETRPLYSETCGTAQRLANGNTLITESDNGRALEVTTDGSIIWEYRNPQRTGPHQEYIAAIMEMVALPAGVTPDWMTSER